MSSTHTQIVLYELPSSLPLNKPLSPFSATIRAALNYKQLAYHVELVPLRDFQSVAASIGAKPTRTLPDGTPLYTVPTMIDSTSGTPVVLSETHDILAYLQSTYPDPSRPLFVGGTASGAVDKLALGAIMEMLFPVVSGLDKAAQYAVVPEGDKAIWRERYLGNSSKSVDDVTLSKDSEEYKALLKKGEEAWAKLAGLLGEAMWFGGEKPVGLDFFVLGVLVLMRDVWSVEWEGVFSKVADGRLRRYLEKGEVHLKFTPASA